MAEHAYKALRTEQGVFTTPPYSAELKPLWRFRDEATARTSAEALYREFESYRLVTRWLDDYTKVDLDPLHPAFASIYRNQGDIVGMDVTRKFIQMGRTRSLRYALRKGGKKYAADGGEIPRTGRVYDAGKLAGAQVFEDYLNRCWADRVYLDAWDAWRSKGDKNGPSKRHRSPERSVDKPLEESRDEEPSTQVPTRSKRRRGVS